MYHLIPIEKNSLEAEEKQELTLLCKANSFRKAVKKKQGILETFTQTINKLQKEVRIDAVEVFML